MPRHRRYVMVDGMRLPVLALAYELDAYRTLGRIERARMLEEWLEQHAETVAAREAAHGLREAILSVLEACVGQLPPTVGIRLEDMDDQAALDEMLVRAATATSLRELGLE